MSEIEVRAISREELPSHRSAFAAMRGVSAEESDVELSFMDWWLFQCPDGPGIYAGAFDGDRLAGAFGFGVETFLIEGRPVRVGIYCNAYTHQDYRGRGVFSKLCNYLVKTAGQMGCEAVFAWANPTASKIFLERLGYSALFYPIRYVRPLDWRPLTQRLGPLAALASQAAQRTYDTVFRAELGPYECSLGPAESGEWSAFLARHHQHASCGVERTPEYLAWRARHPGRDFLQFHIREGGVLQAWAIARLPLAQEVSELRVGAILCSAPTRKLIGALAAALIAEARSRNLGRVYGVGRLSRTLGLLGTTGFAGRRGHTPIVGIATEGASLDQFKHWDFQDTDVDVF